MCTYFLNNNFLDTDVINSATFSSENSTFPYSNLIDSKRRSKVWRSGGSWVIDSTNKTLVFRETTGIDLTATLDEANYQSGALLFAEIKTQLEAVGGSVYTVEADTSTGKVKFTSDGAGGGGILELYWSTSTALAGVLGFDTTDDTGALTYTADELKISTGEWFLWDLGMSSNPKAFVMADQRNSSISLSPSATFTLEGNETNNFSSPSYSETVTYDAKSMVLINSDGLHTDYLRYFRLRLDDPANPNLYLQLGTVYLGDAIVMERGRAQFPFSGSYGDNTITTFSQAGASFSDVKSKNEIFSVDWFGLTIAEKEEVDEHFQKFGLGKPFFMIFDSGAVFSSSAGYYTRYCKFQGEPRYRLVSPGNFAMNTEFREEL